MSFPLHASRAIILRHLTYVVGGGGIKVIPHRTLTEADSIVQYVAGETFRALKQGATCKYEHIIR